MTTTGEILVGRNLSRFRSDGIGVILDNVDIKLSPGDRVGLVGQSGSGKSSLFRVLVKLDPVERGEILYHGKVLSRKGIPKFRRHVVYLPQRPSFAPGTVLENLEGPLRLASSESDLSSIDYESWLERAGKSKSLLEQSVDSLSGGEQQIVALLRAVQIEPNVLLLDEPTAALDANSTDAIEQLVDAWYRQSPERAYAWTSHNMDQIKRRCDRIIQLESGRVVSSSPEAPCEDIP